jgi:hypothetical protein
MNNIYNEWSIWIMSISVIREVEEIKKSSLSQIYHLKKLPSTKVGWSSYCVVTNSFRLFKTKSLYFKCIYILIIGINGLGRVVTFDVR